MAIHLCGIPADWQHPSDRPCSGKFNGRWRLASRLLVHSRLVARKWLERLAWAQITTEQGYEASGSPGSNRSPVRHAPWRIQGLHRAES